jgi:hypothetical protein
MQSRQWLAAAEHVKKRTNYAGISGKEYEP